jgi:hypothetical protein
MAPPRAKSPPRWQQRTLAQARLKTETNVSHFGSALLFPKVAYLNPPFSNWTFFDSSRESFGSSVLTISERLSTFLSPR